MEGDGRECSIRLLCLRILRILRRWLSSIVVPAAVAQLICRIDDPRNQIGFCSRNRRARAVESLARSRSLSACVAARTPADVSQRTNERNTKQSDEKCVSFLLRCSFTFAISQADCFAPKFPFQMFIFRRLFCSASSPRSDGGKNTHSAKQISYTTLIFFLRRRISLLNARNSLGRFDCKSFNLSFICVRVSDEREKLRFRQSALHAPPSRVQLFTNFYCQHNL